jgi:hypothetical protein
LLRHDDPSLSRNGASGKPGAVHLHHQLLRRHPTSASASFSLMDVGVRVEETLFLKKIDEDFFSD